MKRPGDPAGREVLALAPCDAPAELAIMARIRRRPTDAQPVSPAAEAMLGGAAPER